MPFLDLFKNFRKDDADKNIKASLQPTNKENQTSPNTPNQKQQNFVNKVLQINKQPKNR